MATATSSTTAQYAYVRYRDASNTYYTEHLNYDGYGAITTRKKVAGVWTMLAYYDFSDWGTGVFGLEANGTSFIQYGESWMNVSFSDAAFQTAGDWFVQNTTETSFISYDVQSGVIHQGSATVSASGSLTANGRKILLAVQSLLGNSDLDATGYVPLRMLVTGEAALSGNAEMSVDSIVKLLLTGQATLFGASQLTASPLLVLHSGTSVGANSNLVAEGLRCALTAINLAGSAGMESDSNLSFTLGSIQFIISGSMSAAGKMVYQMVWGEADTPQAEWSSVEFTDTEWLTDAPSAVEWAKEGY